MALTATHATTTYRTVAVDGLAIFYREAGPKDAPTLLLLHGFPSSSRMFDTLIPLLADRYHIVGPADLQDVARKLTGTITGTVANSEVDRQQ